MRIKYEVRQIKWLAILVMFVFWCWRQRELFIRRAAEYEAERAYNAWDLVFDQLMHPFPILWLLLPIWLVLSMRMVIESGETAVLIRVRNDRDWLFLLLKKTLAPLFILLTLWGVAIYSTTIGMPFESGWSDFSTSRHAFNFFTYSFVIEGWLPWAAIAAQLLLLAFFLQAMILLLGTAWMYTEKSWAVNLLSAGLMIGSLIAYHKQGHFPNWQWASITNWMLLLNARHTFGAYWPAFIGAPLLGVGCVGLASLRRNRTVYAGFSALKRRFQK